MTKKKKKVDPLTRLLFGKKKKTKTKKVKMKKEKGLTTKQIREILRKRREETLKKIGRRKF